MEYNGEGDGPYLVDLSHRPIFDLQTSNFAAKKPFGIVIPETPGSCVLENGILANRMNLTQSSLYNLAGQNNVSMPDEHEYTDVTESTICVALIGKNIFSICEELTALDFIYPSRIAPFLFQGPFPHVPCQIVTLSKEGDKMGIIHLFKRIWKRYDSFHPSCRRRIQAKTCRGRQVHGMDVSFIKFYNNSIIKEVIAGWDGNFRLPKLSFNNTY